MPQRPHTCIPDSSPWGASAPRKKSGYRPQPWHEADFDSEVEVLLWRLPDCYPLPYGDTYMLKLSSLSKDRTKSGKPAAEDAAASKQYPNIVLLLTATKDDAGKLRKTATLTICAEDGLFKGGIRDRENSASLWKSAKTFDGLFKALEAALDDPDAEWRASESSSRK